MEQNGNMGQEMQPRPGIVPEHIDAIRELLLWAKREDRWPTGVVVSTNMPGGAESVIEKGELLVSLAMWMHLRREAAQGEVVFHAAAHTTFLGLPLSYR